MKLDKKKLLCKLLFLISALSGCTNDLKKVHILYPDLMFKEVREHEFIDYDALIISENPIKVWPISKTDDLMCVTHKDGRLIKEAILKFRKDCNCN